MAPGHGLLSLGLFADNDYMGAGLGLETRVSRALSAYAEAEALWDGKSLDYRGVAGLRLRW